MKPANSKTNETREKLNADVEKFLAKGGKIDTLTGPAKNVSEIKDRPPPSSKAGREITYKLNMERKARGGS